MCREELELAEDLGKEIILAILRDLKIEDSRLARYSDRQFVDLSSFPQDHIEALTWKEQDYRISFNVDALSKIKARLDALGIARRGFSSAPKNAESSKVGCRIFISHSARDNIYALAFRNWLVANGWAVDDIFVDLDNIGAGERWRETLRRASAACEVIVMLASPNSMSSVECQKELELADLLGKEIILAILRDLTPEDALLARYGDRPIVDLSSFPQDHIEALTWKEQDYRIGFNVEALSRIKARLQEVGIANDSFSWPARGGGQPAPYPGLSAFTEDDAGIFFGREAEIMAGMTEIRRMRQRRSPRALVIQAPSGAGKSSFLRAGLWPRLSRDPDFAALAILRPAQGILTGPDGLGRKLAIWFERHGKSRSPRDIVAAITGDGAEAAFASLIAEATEIAAMLRRSATPDARAPAALLAIDQAEELFNAEDEAESRRFLDLLASVLRDPPAAVDPYALITIRANSVEKSFAAMAGAGVGTAAAPRSHPAIAKRLPRRDREACGGLFAARQASQHRAGACRRPGRRHRGRGRVAASRFHPGKAFFRVWRERCADLGALSRHGWHWRLHR